MKTHTTYIRIHSHRLMMYVVHTFIHAYIHELMQHTFTHTYIYELMQHTFTHTYIHEPTQHTFTHTYIHELTQHTFSKKKCVYENENVRVFSENVSECTWECIRIYVYMRIYASLLHENVWECVCVLSECIRMCVWMYENVCVHENVCQLTPSECMRIHVCSLRMYQNVCVNVWECVCIWECMPVYQSVWECMCVRECSLLHENLWECMLREFSHENVYCVSYRVA